MGEQLRDMFHPYLLEGYVIYLPNLQLTSAYFINRSINNWPPNCGESVVDHPTVPLLSFGVWSDVGGVEKPGQPNRKNY